jgi:hypothetical protein
MKITKKIRAPWVHDLTMIVTMIGDYNLKNEGEYGVNMNLSCWGEAVDGDGALMMKVFFIFDWTARSPEDFPSFAMMTDAIWAEWQP